MNERINELLKQSRTEYWTQYTPSYDYEKFAKLIVKECADICMKNQFDGADNYNNGSISSAEFIKQYFGVK